MVFYLEKFYFKYLFLEKNRISVYINIDIKIGVVYSIFFIWEFIGIFNDEIISN